MARQIGDYKLGELLGTGTVGAIYCARNVRTGQTGALKILLPEVSKDENVSARFEREMMILERLDHPNIIRYYGGGRHQGRLYYAMELVLGGSTKNVLQENGRIHWRQAVEVARQVASALQHAHNHGIIHRDLKPGNLFLTREGAIKLGDFGIARDTHAADLTGQNITVGTYAYMSPEQIRGGQQVTPKSDLYSLGCVLFEMLAGRPPFEGDNFAQIFTQHLQDDPPSLASGGVTCPTELEDLIRRLLAKDPAQRPFNARNVQGVLQEIVDRVYDPRYRQAREQGDDQAEPTTLAPVVDLSALAPQGPSREMSWQALIGLALAIICMIGAAWLLNT